MRIATAITLVEQLTYKPGWAFTATDHSNRFEGVIKIRVDYPARNSARDQAEAGYPEEIVTYAEFPILVGDCGDGLRLYRRLLASIVEIETHEAREFLRLPESNWAPFHPHRIDGMRNWAAMAHDPDAAVMQGLSRDLQFGIA
ncbi:hypothetical protein [Streptomyces halobius]|uniref:Uncharacterized protein n=1 Tax=Streptomyces halobius TaxID=2879846 RepID=A0ABY4M1M4_9ACTN|nr:hypothetical protein [Streptomyces halobius]UQA91656.1 hypothetical protein K9S39_07075 [Streptomyces halobius]